MTKKVYAFDLDGTLCHTPNGNDYANSTPIKSRIIHANRLFAKGNRIIIYTARGCKTGLTSHLEALTKHQLKEWKISHHELVMGQKIHYDILVDDKAISADRWEKEQELGTLGIISGSFDVLHPGYIKMFKEAELVCSRILVALQEKGKRQPILSVEDRIERMMALRCVNKVITYTTEEDLVRVLKANSPHVRILGNDYIGKDYTGMHLGQDVHYVDRSHGWSTTRFLDKLRGNKQPKKKNNRNRRNRNNKG